MASRAPGTRRSSVVSEKHPRVLWRLLAINECPVFCRMRKRGDAFGLTIMDDERRVMARANGEWSVLCAIADEWRVRLEAKGYAAEIPVCPPKQAKRKSP